MHKTNKKCQCSYCEAYSKFKSLLERATPEELEGIEWLGCAWEDAVINLGMLEGKIEEGEPFVVNGKWYKAKEIPRPKT